MSNLLSHIVLETGKNPQYSLIWLHGLGANGEDFVPIVDEIHLAQEVRYLFPNAPKRPVTINGGFVMPAWYDIRNAAIDSAQDAEGIHASQVLIEQLIQHEVSKGIPEKHIFLVGFSQGGAMALHCGLRTMKQLGGIVALSAYLPLAERVEAEANAHNLSMPIFMAHGLSDPIVPFELGKTSATKLEQIGYPPEWHVYPMQHTVCMEEVADIERWLKERMAK
ncbi:MAG: dienelactone hydrolase family protein [Sideroxydans sp.]|nr:dienelactone hydrolase family protein [Sideroxydans sp.]